MAPRHRPTIFSTAWVAAFAIVAGSCGGGGSDAEPAATASDTEPVVSDVPTATAPATTPDTVPETTPRPDARCGVRIEVGEYDDIACDRPHDAEYVAMIPAPDDTDPISLMAACGPAVEEFIDRSLLEFGLDVGVVQRGAGNDIECWAETSSKLALSASIGERGVTAALGDGVFITDLEPGTCFVRPDPDGFDIATTVGCDDPDAEMIFGKFAADDGPPPDQATVDAFFERCSTIFGDADFDRIGNTEYLITPLDDNWEALARRTVLCIFTTDPDAEPIEDEATVPDPAAAVGAVCANHDESIQDYPPVPCDELHDAEYAGSVTPPPGTLPDDADEASALLLQLCTEPVVALTGLDLTTFGGGVGTVSVDGLGAPMVNDVRCYATAGAPVYLGSIGELGYAAVLAAEIVADLEPGTCFTYPFEDNFVWVDVASCDDPGALMVVGAFIADFPPGAPYPGVDQLRSIRFERCSEILAASGLAVDPTTLSGTFTGENDWKVLDRREITCDAEPR